jgi:hypothetical protein
MANKKHDDIKIVLSLFFRWLKFFVAFKAHLTQIFTPFLLEVLRLLGGRVLGSLEVVDVLVLASWGVLGGNWEFVNVLLNLVCILLDFVCIPLDFVCIPLDLVCLPLELVCIPLDLVCIPLDLVCIPLDLVCLP